MTNIFALQLVVSFFIGGGIITLLTFYAEKSSSRVSGIILSFPSTVLISFFFIAWTQSTEELVAIIPATIIPIGVSILFPVFYIYLAKLGSLFIKQKILHILFSLVFSILAWLVLSIPMAYHKMTNIYFGIMGYILLGIISYLLLNREKHKSPPTHSYTYTQIGSRALFVGFLIALVVFLGEFTSPFWGGVLAIFPAALISSLLVIHWIYGYESLFAMTRKLPIGSLSIFVYVISVMLIFPIVGFVWGTLLSLLISLLTSYLLTQLGKLF